MRRDITVPIADGERISRLETSVEGLHDEFRDLRMTLKSIQDSVTRSRETNWPLVFSGLMLIGSLYAAAIRPLEGKLAETDARFDSFAQAGSPALERRILVLETELRIRADELSYIREHGSPITDKRLALLEHEMFGD